jgi:hypothetical protein
MGRVKRKMGRLAFAQTVEKPASKAARDAVSNTYKTVAQKNKGSEEYVSANAHHHDCHHRYHHHDCHHRYHRYHCHHTAIIAIIAIIAITSSSSFIAIIATPSSPIITIIAIIAITSPSHRHHHRYHHRFFCLLSHRYHIAKSH